MLLAGWLSLSGTRVQVLRARLLNDPYYRFQNLDEIKLAIQLGISIDVNQANVDDWLRLPGMSIHQARCLVSLNQAGVQFHCLDDIAAALNLSVQRLKPLESILKFCYYAPESICTPSKTNVNTASLEGLTKIPGVDLYLARAIAHNRQQYGAYRNQADFQQRLAVPGSLMADLMHYLSF